MEPNLSKKPETQSEALSGLSRSLSSHLEKMRPVYERLAEAHGFSVGFGEITCFDHTRDKVLIGVSQFERLGITTPELIDFVVLHEIGHFCEYHQDPNGYLAINEEAKRREGIEGRLYFDLYNCLQDIFVNKNTADRAPQYREGEGYSAPIQAFYTERAFANRNFNDRPRCVQFSQYLLNLGMGVAEDIVLSGDVRSEIDKGLKLFGQGISYEEFINKFLLPPVGHRSPEGWHGTMTQRRAVIEQAIVPVFEKLLEIDKNEARELEGFIVNPLSAFEPDPQSIEDAAKAGAKKIADKNLTPEERATLEREKQAGEIAKDAELTESEAADFTASLHRVQPIVHELVAIFMELRAPMSEWRNVMDGPFARGSDLDIDSAINHFDQVLRDPSRASVFMRKTPVEERTYLPKKVRLWVIPDLSGSMSDNLSDLRDVTLALAASTVVLSQQAEYTDSDLTGELGIIGFDTKETVLLEPAPSLSLEPIARVFPKITADGKDTNDHTALKAVLDRVKNFRSVDSTGEILDILIEITDGETRNPDLSRDLRRELQSLDVHVGAIHIGGSTMPDVPKDDPGHIREDDETLDSSSGRSFDHVWNCDEKKLGKYIFHPSQLGKAVRRILEDLISDYSEKKGS